MLLFCHEANNVGCAVPCYWWRFALTQIHATAALYFVWLGIALTYTVYQAQFLFADYLDRPEAYDVTSGVLFFLDLAAYVSHWDILSSGLGGLGIASIRVLLVWRLHA